MKRFSRSIGVLMVVLGLVLALAACGGGSAKESSGSSKSSEEKEVVVPEGEPEIVFTGEAVAEYGLMEPTLDLYEDGTVIMTIKYGGKDNVYDGSWSMSKDQSTISLDLNDREGSSWEVVKGDDGSYAFEYKTFDGKGEAVIPLTTNPK
jgi:ABC-type glycerol-3-phosphate transport system substrate-binding protein